MSLVKFMISIFLTRVADSLSRIKNCNCREVCIKTNILMKKAIVIGASSGLGRELAMVLADNDYMVGITARREELLNELAATRPTSYQVSAFDLYELENVIPRLDELVEKMGGLDLLVISAGQLHGNTELDYAVEYNTNMVNVNAFTLISNWALRYFQMQSAGHLVGITSVAGARGWRNNPAYNAGKAYQINYLEGLRNLMSKKKMPITVSTVIPGYIETRMKGKSLVFWVVEPDVAAKQIFRSIRKKKKIIYTLRRWRMGYWLYKRVPNILIEKF